MSLETFEAAVLAEIRAEFEDEEYGCSVPEVVYTLDKIRTDIHLNTALAESDEDEDFDDEEGDEEGEDETAES